MIGKLFYATVVEHSNTTTFSQRQPLVDSIWFGSQDYEIKTRIRQFLVGPVYIDCPISIHLGLGNRFCQGGNQKMKIGGIQAWRVAVFPTLGIRRISFIVTFCSLVPILCDGIPNRRDM